MASVVSPTTVSVTASCGALTGIQDTARTAIRSRIRRP